MLFIWEPIPIAVTAILASISYGALGIVKMSTVFSGYDNNNILLAGMMVVGSSLFHTGITDKIGEKDDCHYRQKNGTSSWQP